MNFAEPIFLFLFLPAALLVCLACGRRFRNTALFAASVLFYAMGEGRLVLVLLALCAFNWAVGLWIWRARGTRLRLLPLCVGVAGNLAPLLWYKYSVFAAVSVSSAVAATFPGLRFAPPLIEHLPIGMSFFTFKAITYVVDIHRGDAPPERNPLRAALYITLFPQLISGPIMKWRDAAGQIMERRVTLDGFTEGAARIIIGLGKKKLIADTLAVKADMIFGVYGGAPSMGMAWLGAILFTFQIYYDFAGYTDIAIGIGRMLGFKFPENFDYPYSARSIREFWRRWHITLSTWFRDYVYIPLGGGRARPERVYLNLILVFLLCGVWHGAGWNFVVWGLWHGTFVVVERAGLGKLLDRAPRPLAWLYTITAVTFGWVFFRSSSLDAAVSYIHAMFGANMNVETAVETWRLFTTDLAIAGAIAISCSWPVVPVAAAALKRFRERLTGGGAAAFDACSSAAWIAFLAAVFALSAAAAAADTFSPFIYSNF